MIIRNLSRKIGFTLVEVVISCALIAIAFISFEALIYTTRYFISYSKHRLQAIYAARTVLDMERAAAFNDIKSTQFNPPTYPGCNMDKLNAIVTVTTYPTIAGPYNDPSCLYRKTVQVTVSWNENMNGVPIMKQESLTTDIANDPVIN